MAKKKPYVVLKTTAAGVHVQIRGGNNRIVWTTEVYENPRNADRAIDLLFELVQEVQALGGDEMAILEEFQHTDKSPKKKEWKLRKRFQS